MYEKFYQETFNRVCGQNPAAAYWSARNIVTIGNVTNTGTNDLLSVYEYCPFDYCRPIDMDLDLMNQDKQCDYNRNGVLCGQCQGDLRMVFGTSV